MPMVLQSFKNKTVNEMLQCEATRQAFWSMEFMILADHELKFTRIERMLKIELASDASRYIEISIDATLEQLNTEFTSMYLKTAK